MIVDSHAHYDDPAFDADRDEVLKRVFEVTHRVINIGINAERSRSTAELAYKYPQMYAAVGIHPLETDNFEKELPVIEKLAELEKVAAIGEIGLDYHIPADRERQKAAFAAQLEIAGAHSLPVVIHTRNAWEDTFEILERYRPEGVVHSFSGSAQTALRIIRLGMYIGFTGFITDPNVKKGNKALSVIPAERILIETDAPCQPPISHRGERCDSLMLPETAAHIAAAKGTETELFATLAAENTLRLFNIGRDRE